MSEQTPETAEKTDPDWMKVLGNAMLIAALVPETGDAGTFLCPACKSGTVEWHRARVNGHIRFHCDGCKVSLIQ